MMNSLAVCNTGTIAADQVQDITLSLFNGFVRFIDRTERTTKTYLSNLRQFMAWLKYSSISRPIRDDVISYREWLSSEHSAIVFSPETEQGWTYRTDKSGTPIKVNCKANTVKIYLQSVKQFFKWTAANGLYPDIAVNVHTPKVSDTHKKDSLTAAEVQTVEASIVERSSALNAMAAAAVKDTLGRIQRSTEQGKRLYAMYLLAVNAGLRTIEISRANIRDLETKGKKTYLSIWGKGRAEADQRKPIAPEVKAAIDDYLSSRSDKKTGSSPLFVSTGNRSGGKRIASTTISTMIKKALQQAGFDSDRLTAHSLRHTTAANVMQLTGNNIYMSQQYLRHSSPKTTEAYLENDTLEQDEGIATQLYKKYHGIESNKKEQLKLMIDSMTPEQLDQVSGFASVITK